MKPSIAIDLHSIVPSATSSPEDFRKVTKRSQNLGKHPVLDGRIQGLMVLQSPSTLY
jgi:hypothetical protein